MLTDVTTEETVSSTLQIEQEARAQLRESFLRAIQELSGQSCKIITYEKSELRAIFSGWEPRGTEVLVNDLETPASIKMSSALLRTPDILAVQFQEHIELP